MANGFLQGLGSTLSIPVSSLVSGVHAWFTGRAALLDLEVAPLDDAMTRQAVIHRLRRVATDDRVAGVVLALHAAPGSWAACHDLRETVLRLRQAGKCVYAVLESAGNAQMWIASACDRTFLVPTGEVSLVGVGAELMFFGRALERLGIEPDFEAAGAYKSFGEPYTRSYASPENQEALTALVGGLHEQLVADVADGRRIDRARVEEAIRRAPLTPEQAKGLGLVDVLAYDDEVDEFLEEHHGAKSQRVSFYAWARRDALAEWIDGWGAGGDRVAVLHLDGPIVMDHPGPGLLVRARRVVPVLRALRENARVRAVVLHVNSPGGHALASDLMWREVERLKREKPVVACFEDVAASGGYYLAAPAQEILARPTTLTGSIGVFGGKLVLGEGLRKLGITTQTFLAGPNAAMLSASRPFTDEQRDRFRHALQRFYDGFVEKVAAGRRAPPATLEPYCRGRVWTGRDARQRGLVDRQGDLIDAVERARVLAGLRVGEFRRVDMSAMPSRSVFVRILHRVVRDLLPGGAGLRAAERLLGVSPALQVVLDNPAEPLAMLPYEVDVR